MKPLLAVIGCLKPLLAVMGCLKPLLAVAAPCPCFVWFFALSAAFIRFAGGICNSDDPNPKGSASQ